MKKLKKSPLENLSPINLQNPRNFSRAGDDFKKEDNFFKSFSSFSSNSTNATGNGFDAHRRVNDLFENKNSTSSGNNNYNTNTNQETNWDLKSITNYSGNKRSKSKSSSGIRLSYKNVDTQEDIRNTSYSHLNKSRDRESSVNYSSMNNMNRTTLNNQGNNSKGSNSRLRKEIESYR
jgi:hypothetical protein